VRAFERIGLELFAEPADGVLVWARFLHIDDSLALTESRTARRHHAGAWHGLPPASRALAVEIMSPTEDDCSPEETAQRMERALRKALNTPPQPHGKNFKSPVSCSIM
jgi:hypothetical protein